MTTNEGKEQSFWDLYTDNIITIPQIQRDYIQGRNNERIKLNRINFIKTLVEHLINGEKIILNFVYGYHIENHFIPIDGQQRLTTLFLLYFYVLLSAKQKEKLRINEKLNFSYETRYTTDRFFNNLFDNCKDLSIVDNIKEQIKKANWYNYSWNNDPSIISCLEVLNDIQESFKLYKKIEWEELSNKLTGINCPIKFMLLEIDKNKLGKPNQLYIKMNSRGKQLTDFENFKASLYEYIDNNKDSASSELKDKIKKEIDGNWYKLIWDLNEDKELSEKYTDIYFRDLLHALFVNRLCVSTSNDKLKDIKEWLLPNKKGAKNIFLENYTETLDLDKFKDYLKDIFNTLQLFCFLNNKDKSSYDSIKKKLMSYVNDDSYKNPLTGYKERVLLMSITKFSNEFQDSSYNPYAFKQWLRIITNLTSNTEIDDPDTYSKVCISINSFANDNTINISKNPKSINKLSGFSYSQITEEIFKLSVLNKNSSWENAIFNAEAFSYFNSEILFSFPLADIHSLDTINLTTLESYKKIWSKIEKVMLFAKENDVLFHRLLLIYGDYSNKAPGRKGDIGGIITYYQYNEKHHNHDWRGMLRPNKNDANETFNLTDQGEVFKSLIKDVDINSINDLKTFAEDKIDKYQLNSASPSLKDYVNYYLIKIGDLFDYCKNKYYLWHDTAKDYDRYVLMKTSKLNEYYEVLSYALTFLVEEKVIPHKGKNRHNPENESRSYAETSKKEIVEYKKDYFIDENNSNYNDDNQNPISNLEELIKKLALNKK